MEKYYVYQITIGFCFFFWAYFDSISNMFIKQKITKNKNTFEKDNASFLNEFRFHFILKTFFYIACIWLLFSIDLWSLFTSFIGFYIGNKYAEKDSSIDNILLNDDHEKMNKGIQYASVSAISFLVFFASFIIL